MSALCLCVIFLSAAGFASGLNTTDGSNQTPEDAVTSDPSVAVETPPQDQDLQISITAMDVGDQGGSRSQIWGDRSGWGQEEEVLEQWQRWWLDRHTRDQMMVRKLITPGDTEEQEDQNNPGVMRKIYEEFDISCCPLVYYGQRYQRLYVNHTLGSSMVCFDGPMAVGGDCVQMPPMVLLQLVATNRARVLSANFSSFFPQVDPNLATCSLELTLQFTDKESILKTYQFKDHTIFHLDAHVKGVKENATFLVKGQERFSWTLQDLENVDLFLLPAACRQGDSIINPNTLISVDPKTCISSNCDSFGRTVSSGCGHMQTCSGAGSCVWDSLCCVLGPLLVDVSGSVVLIPDRCRYTLLNMGHLRIDANFSERRRSDVSFIHSITFTFFHYVFLLEQGGRLSLNGEPLVVTAAPRLYFGMEVSQRDEGITMTVTWNTRSITLVSDGTMVQIIVKGLQTKYYWGWCRNASRMVKLPSSPENCHVSYPEPPDQSINRTAVKERCQVFLQDRFSSCHEEVHPEPFVTSCVSLFSEYPDKDRLFCQMVQSYTSICNRRVQGRPEHQEISCSRECVGASFGCLDFFCSDHEFCGTSRYGDPYCMCRAIYAKPFRESGTYTLPVHCGLTSTSISLVTCLLEETGFSPLELRLQDPSCEGLMDPHTHILTFSYEHNRPCGAQVQLNGEPLVVTAAPRLYFGMEVSQRDEGITMTVTWNTRSITLVSDGTMVQIIVKEPPDQSINRTAVKERCQVFLQDRFSSCHEEVHPEPFVTSCVSLFSEYPDKDRLFCQMVQSYTSICNRRVQGRPEHQEISCSRECVGASFGCLDFFCSDHEFCGTSRYGDPYCMCRAIYAKPFRESGTYTLPVHCGLTSTSISLVTCLLEETGFSPLELRLQDPSCEGLMDPHTHILTFSYEHNRPCGAQVQSSFSQTVYKNAIVFSNSSSNVITRQQDFHVSFECVYANTKELSQLYTAVQNSVSIHSSGFRDRMVQMNLYLDQNLSRLVGPKEMIELNTKVWLEVKALDGRRNLKLLSCWSTPTPAADGPVRHHLVQKSCPNPDDGTVLVEKNGVDISSVISFRMFQFLGISNIIHLHCSLHVCVSPCPMDCPSASV